MDINRIVYTLLPEKCEDTKGVIRSRRRRTDNTMAKRNWTNNDLQNIIQRVKDQATPTPLKTGMNACDPEG
jgi:hypothetical protein